MGERIEVQGLRGGNVLLQEIVTRDDKLYADVRLSKFMLPNPEHGSNVQTDDVVYFKDKFLLPVSEYGSAIDAIFDLRASYDHVSAYSLFAAHIDPHARSAELIFCQIFGTVENKPR